MLLECLRVFLPFEETPPLIRDISYIKVLFWASWFIISRAVSAPYLLRGK